MTSRATKRAKLYQRDSESGGGDIGLCLQQNFNIIYAASLYLRLIQFQT
jgi:hypothetical protein